MGDGDPDVCKVSIVGVGMVSQAGINIQMISTSEIKISCVVKKEEGKKAVIILGAVPIMMLILAKPAPIVVFTLLAFILALITHRNDVYRFITGKELKTSEAINRYMK